MDFNGFHILDLGIFHHIARFEHITIPHQSDLLAVGYILLSSEIMSDALESCVLGKLMMFIKKEMFQGHTSITISLCVG
jgi:hypothetical protein